MVFGKEEVIRHHTWSTINALMERTGKELCREFYELLELVKINVRSSTSSTDQYIQYWIKHFFSLNGSNITA